MAYDPAFTGGVSVGSDFLTGDVTGDGVPDIVTGAGAGAAHPSRRSASHSYTSWWKS